MDRIKIIRCKWAGEELMMRDYHDTEWGVPVYDDRELFEFLILEGAQAGLSWSTILKRRQGYREAFENFDVNKIARYADSDLERLVQDERIIRNKLKIKSAINNAKHFLEVQKEFGSFSKYIWQFVNNEPIQNDFSKLSEIPATTPLSNEISKDMKKRGFNFIGPTICYALMQSIGMVNDHVISCYRYEQIKALSKKE